MLFILGCSSVREFITTPTPMFTSTPVATSTPIPTATLKAPPSAPTDWKLFSDDSVQIYLPSSYLDQELLGNDDEWAMFPADKETLGFADDSEVVVVSSICSMDKKAISNGNITLFSVTRFEEVPEDTGLNHVGRIMMNSMLSGTSELKQNGLEQLDNYQAYYCQATELSDNMLIYVDIYLFKQFDNIWMVIFATTANNYEAFYKEQRQIINTIYFP